MTSDPGLLTGLVVFVALCLGVFLAALVQRRIANAAWKRANPIEPGSGAKLLERLAELARPTVLLTPATRPGVSKLGGHPDLPSGAGWPQGDHGPLAFLAQIDLAELQAAEAIDWLPPEGRLYVFCDPDGYGWAEQVRVVFSRDDPDPARPPLARAYGERRVGFTPFVSVPSPEWLNVEDCLDMDFEEIEARLNALDGRPPGEDRQHRIGGYPDEIQGGCLRLECEDLDRGLARYVPGVAPAPDVERASWDWRLLVQVDSDPALKMNWGDGGRLYVFVREQDARAADFSKTVTLSQWY